MNLKNQLYLENGYLTKNVSKTQGTRLIVDYFYPKISQKKIKELIEQLKPSAKGIMGGICPQWCSGFETNWSFSYNKYPIELIQELGKKLIQKYGQKKSNRWNQTFTIN